MTLSIASKDFFHATKYWLKSLQQERGVKINRASEGIEWEQDRLPTFFTGKKGI